MKNLIRILFIGDIVGDPGVHAVTGIVPGWLKEEPFDLVIANGENASSGRGITIKQVKPILNAGVHVITGGNHIFDREKAPDAFGMYAERLLRPANYPPDVMGRGFVIVQVPGKRPVAILNLQGRLYMPLTDCPFQTTDRILPELLAITPNIFVDFHGEATAEKIAFAKNFDGQVSAIAGTHTHVPTADAEILPLGTAFITDVGMTGSHDGVIGMDTAASIKRFRTTLNHQSGGSSGDIRLNAAIIEIDADTGKGISIVHQQRKMPAL
ncbi:MAG: YmdB family metallophosphoesterase [bacterium]|nr:YmdB family metallophosphoesterase [bacterium]